MKPIKKRFTQKEIACQAKIGPDFLSHIIHGDRLLTIKNDEPKKEVFLEIC